MTKETNSVDINAKYRISVTAHSWIVEKKNADKYDICKSYTSLESLLNNFGDYLGRQGNSKDILASYEKAHNTVRKAIDKNSELILSLANDSLRPVIRESHTKIQITNGGN